MEFELGPESRKAGQPPHPKAEDTAGDEGVPETPAPHPGPGLEVHLCAGRLAVQAPGGHHLPPRGSGPRGRSHICTPQSPSGLLCWNLPVCLAIMEVPARPHSQTY